MDLLNSLFMSRIGILFNATHLKINQQNHSLQKKHSNTSNLGLKMNRLFFVIQCVLKMKPVGVL